MTGTVVRPATSPMRVDQPVQRADRTIAQRGGVGQRKEQTGNSEWVRVRRCGEEGSALEHGEGRRTALRQAQGERGWASFKWEGRASTCWRRSEEHTSELQSLMRISYAVFCLKKKRNQHTNKYIE